MPDRDMMIKPTTDGWVEVLLDAGPKISLPACCHVKFRSTANGRDSIVIQEGLYAAKAATVKIGYLVVRKHDAKALVTFYLRSNVLTWSGGPATKPVNGGGVSGGMPSFTDPSNPVPQGSWDIEMPDSPHKGGQGYTGFAGHATCWFRIAAPDSKDRYIHPGTVSEGCTTVGVKGDKISGEGQAALKNYEKLYAYLIARRKSPGVVGQIQVMNL